MNQQQSQRFSLLLIILLAVWLFPLKAESQGSTLPPLPAFPGAEGYGAQAIGGRGGQVIEVTNLADSGPGSLRSAIETEGPRIVVFRVAGTIELLTSLRIKHPFITLAGQTAPGDGITLKNHPSNTEPALFIEADHVMIRYLRIRPGPSEDPAENVDALAIKGGQHIIIDQSSFSWATDENVSIWDQASDITIQWSIISEGLHNSTFIDGAHSRGILIGEESTRISFHHNLLAHNNGRNPRVQGGTVDLVNNVIYNAERTPTRIDDETNPDGVWCNYVGNTIKPGPNSTWDYELKLTNYQAGGTSCFLKGNLGRNRPDEALPETAIVHPDGRQFVVETRYKTPPITTTSAPVAYRQVLARAGANRPRRDAVDTRILAEVANGTGAIIDDPAEVGGWPHMPPATPPLDSDHDGMPDAWERVYALDPDDPSDGPEDADGDGYTNVESYLNGMAPRLPKGRIYLPIILLLGLFKAHFIRLLPFIPS